MSHGPSEQRGPQHIGPILDQLLADLNRRRQFAPGLQRLFEGMREYQALREDVEGVVDAETLAPFVPEVTIPLGAGRAFLHLQKAIAAGFDGLVASALFEDRETRSRTRVAAKFSRPYKPVADWTLSCECPYDDTLEAASNQYAALTELATHRRLHVTGVQSIPKLFAATVLESVDETDDQMTLTVMEYIEGKRLDELTEDIVQGRADFATLRPVLETMADTFIEMHERGVCLWDTNPRNVIIQGETRGESEARVTLLDFGRSHITGALDFYREHNFDWYPQIPENDPDRRDKFEQLAVVGLGEAWLDVAREITQNPTSSSEKARMLEALCHSIREENISSLREIPPFIRLLFREE